MLDATAKNYALPKGKRSDLAMVLVTYVHIQVSMYHLLCICILDVHCMKSRTAFLCCAVT